MKHKFSALDAIRGVAALFVLTRHSDSLWGFSLFRSYLAVDLFFLLSGFVIAHNYEDALRSKRLGAVRFMVLRCIRLYPMYAISLLIAIILDHDWHSPQSILKGILMFPSLGQGNLFPLDVTYWSLFFELVVNAIYAWACKWLTDRSLILVVLLLGVALILAAIHYGGINLGWGGNLSHLFTGFLRALFGITLGVLLYRRRQPLADLLPQSFGPILAITVIAVALCSPSTSLYRRDGLVDIVVVCLVFPVCVLASSRFPLRQQMQRTAAILGAASYPIYLLHPLGYELSRRIGHDALDAFAPLSGLAFMVVMVVLSIALERFVDIPVRRLLSRGILKSRAVASLMRGPEAADKGGPVR